MSVYKLFGAATGGTENAVASLDIQFDGEIVAMHYSVVADLDADGDTVNMEVSFLATAATAVHDTRGSLITASTQHAIGAAGAVNSGMLGSINGVRIPISAGERVFMHFANTASLTGSANVYIYTVDTGTPELRRRR